MENSVLDLVLGGTSDAILMIEGFCDFLTEEQMLVAVEAGHAAVRVACLAIADWCAHVMRRCLGLALMRCFLSLRTGRREWGRPRTCQPS